MSQTAADRRGATKVCAICGVEQPESEFLKAYSKERQRFRRSPFCHPCRRQRMRDYNLRQYGLTREQFDALLDAQGGKCAICGGPPKARLRLCVDHDHSTGRVRGLLCVPCNALIGNAYESVEILDAARAYLVATLGR